MIGKTSALGRLKMGKDKKAMNPNDAYRKQMKKKEIKRNKVHKQEVTSCALIAISDPLSTEEGAGADQA